MPRNGSLDCLLNQPANRSRCRRRLHRALPKWSCRSELHCQMGLLAVVAAELLLEQAAAPAIIMKLMAMPLMQCNLPPWPRRPFCLMAMPLMQCNLPPWPRRPTIFRPPGPGPQNSIEILKGSIESLRILSCWLIRFPHEILKGSKPLRVPHKTSP